MFLLIHYYVHEKTYSIQTRDEYYIIYIYETKPRERKEAAQQYMIKIFPPHKTWGRAGVVVPVTGTSLCRPWPCRPLHK